MIGVERFLHAKNMKLKKQLTLLLITLSCAGLLRAEIRYNLDEDISYYPSDFQPSDDYIREKCKLDVYYPANTSNFATVVWFHGGGLTAGSKEIPDGLKEKGIAVVSVNYRLSPKVTVKECVEDAAAAIAWTFKNIGNYGGLENSIFLSGHSAGGYLALMVGLNKELLVKWRIDANTIAGIIPLSGHTITHFTERQVRGIPGYQPIIDELAPLFYVRPDAAPILLITGDRELELLGRYEENAYMMRMMKVAGHEETNIIEIKDYGHNIVKPAIPLLLDEVERISRKRTN